jgi:Ni/Fe-hydrogenase 1 B-type cytochrome subunit
MQTHATSATTSAVTSEPQFRRVYVWQWGVRAFHWVNAAAVATLFLTGLFIADPIVTSSGEPWHTFLMANVRMVHHAAAFVFLVSFVWRIYWFWFGNVHARSGFPYVWRREWWSDLFRQARAYLHFDFGHPHLGHNSLAGLSYTVCVILVGWCQIFTGFALYSQTNVGGFWDGLTGWVIPFLGGGMRVHSWHHLFAWSFLAFTILHLYIVWLDSRQYRNGLIVSMITGYKFQRVDAPGKKEKDGR